MSASVRELKGSLPRQQQATRKNAMPSRAHADSSTWSLACTGLTPKLSSYLNHVVHAVQATHVERPAVTVDGQLATQPGISCFDKIAATPFLAQPQGFQP